MTEELDIRIIDLERLKAIIAEQQAMIDSPILTEHNENGHRTHVTIEWPNPDVRATVVTRELIDEIVKILDDREASWIYFDRKESRNLEYALGLNHLYDAENREELDDAVRKMKKDGVFDDFVFYKVKRDTTIGVEPT